MRAMILAAGLGTRLRPLTFCRPKALVPVMGMTLLEYWVYRLHRAGFEGVIVNACSLGEKLLETVSGRTWPIPVEVIIERDLLGTGGGIRNALDFFQKKPFMVVNGDIVCNAHLEDLYGRHVASGCPVSMLMHHWPAFNNVAVDSKDQVLGFGQEAQQVMSRNPDAYLSAFTGIHVINPEVLKELPAAQPCDIITIYRRLIREGTSPQSIREPNLYWREAGSVEAYWSLNRELCSVRGSLLDPLPTGAHIRVHPKARLEPDVHLEGMVVVGTGAWVKEGAHLEDVILWDGVQIERGTRLVGCVVTDGVKVCGEHERQIITEDSV